MPRLRWSVHTFSFKSKCESRNTIESMFLKQKVCFIEGYWVVLVFGWFFTIIFQIDVFSKLSHSQARYEELASSGSVTPLKFRLVGDTSTRYGTKNDMAHEAPVEPCSLWSFLDVPKPSHQRLDTNGTRLLCNACFSNLSMLMIIPI